MHVLLQHDPQGLTALQMMENQDATRSSDL